MVRNSLHVYTFLTYYRLIVILDKEVGKIFTQISVSKSEAYIKLDEKDFYEKRSINQKKKWILNGLDPDEEEKKLLKKFKHKSNNNKHKKFKNKMKKEKNISKT